MHRVLGQGSSSVTAETLVWVLPVISCMLAIALFAPRFTVTAPSLVDDWYALTYAPVAVDQILHGSYDAGAVDYGGRYRPAYSVLSYVQWPLLGSGDDTTIPTLFGLGRLLLFMGVVAGLTVVFTRGVTTRPWVVLAAAVVPALAVGTAGMTVNFVRFGVVEPTWFAALALSLSAITVAVGRLATSETRRERLRALSLFVGGYLLYVFGVYLVEASVAVVALLPALYFWLARSPDVRAAGHWGKRQFAAVSVLLLAPLLHVVSQVVPELGRGDAGGFALHTLLSAMGGPALGTLRGSVLGLGTPLWAALFLLVAAACVHRARSGDRHAVLSLGMMAVGALAAYVSSFAAHGLSRYYVPWLVAVAVAAARLMMGLSPRTRVLALGVIMAGLLLGRPDAHVRSWIELDHAGSEAITLASSAQATGCPVYLVGFPGERRMALARLLREPSEPALPVACGPASRKALALTWGAVSSGLLEGCRESWRGLARGLRVELRVCEDFRERSRIPTQDIGLEDPARVVRLVEPTGFVSASTLHSET